MFTCLPEKKELRIPMLKAFVKVIMISVVLAAIIAGLSYSHNAPPRVNPAAAASTPGSVVQPELSGS